MRSGFGWTGPRTERQLSDGMIGIGAVTSPFRGGMLRQCSLLAPCAPSSQSGIAQPSWRNLQRGVQFVHQHAESPSHGHARLPRGFGVRRWPIYGFLQCKAPAFEPRRPHPGPSLLPPGTTTCSRLKNSRPVSGLRSSRATPSFHGAQILRFGMGSRLHRNTQVSRHHLCQHLT